MSTVQFTKTKVGADYNRFYLLTHLKVYAGDESIVRITTINEDQVEFKWQGVTYMITLEKPVFLFFRRKRYEIVADGQVIGEMRIGTWKKTTLLLYNNAESWLLTLKGSHWRTCQATLQSGSHAIVYIREAKKSRLVNSYDDQQIAHGKIETGNSDMLTILLGLALMEIDIHDRQRD